jgi:UPF0755 protein
MTIDKKSKLMLFPRMGKYIIIFFAIAFIIVGIRSYQLYQYVFRENINTDFVLYIPKDATYKQVSDSLSAHNTLISMKAFNWVSKKKEYGKSVKTGRYLLKEGMNTNQIVNMLKGGLQTPLNVTFNNVRTKEDLAGKVCKYLQTDSISILKLFEDTIQIKDYGFTAQTYSAMFIPDTYEFYWTTSAQEFADRMKLEYERFWNDERKKKAEEINLTPVEITTLASIVQAETAKNEELKTIAGLYINRLNRGMFLQADPTVKFAVGDFALKRILYVHLEIDSPYNTYKYIGLPPGPINFPETSAINAVLNYEKNKYYYMCAKEDFSGYHNFAATLSEHNRNAAKYRAALDRNKIK